MDSLQNQPVIYQNGSVIYTTSLYSSYQWYKDSIAILGADSSSYNTSGQSGGYYLKVSLDCGCNNVASNLINIGVSSTWDCLGSSCIDLGNGMGMYTDSLQCLVNCLSADLLSINHMNKGKLIKIIDVLGRVMKGVKNRSLFYIYDDGTVEKKIIVE